MRYLAGCLLPRDQKKFLVPANKFGRTACSVQGPEDDDDGDSQTARWNKPLTATALTKIDSMLVEAGTGSPEDLERAKAERPESLGLRLFVRSLIDLDREAAKQASDSFLQDKSLNANQVEVVNLVIEL